MPCKLALGLNIILVIKPLKVKLFALVHLNLVYVCNMTAKYTLNMIKYRFLKDERLPQSMHNAYITYSMENRSRHIMTRKTF